jgi:ribA/ribD-fused uncharacterized protein
MESSLQKSMEIKGFFNQYRFLSNFYPSRIYYIGVWYPTAEHAYQCQKPKNNSDRSQMIVESIVKDITTAEIKAWGSSIELRDDWEDVKLRIMEEIVSEKFTNAYTKTGVPLDLRSKLLATGDSHLEETNYWGDRFWGVCRGKGENHLGKILMAVRKQLQEEVKNEAKGRQCLCMQEGKVCCREGGLQT